MTYSIKFLQKAKGTRKSEINDKQHYVKIAIFHNFTLYFWQTPMLKCGEWQENFHEALNSKTIKTIQFFPYHKIIRVLSQTDKHLFISILDLIIQSLVIDYTSYNVILLLFHVFRGNISTPRGIIPFWVKLYLSSALWQRQKLKADWTKTVTKIYCYQQVSVCSKWIWHLYQKSIYFDHNWKISKQYTEQFTQGSLFHICKVNINMTLWKSDKLCVNYQTRNSTSHVVKYISHKNS